MSNEYAEVYVLDIPYSIDRSYDYYIPVDMRGSVARGSFVTVPFGAGNRRHMALVHALKNKCEYTEVKPIGALCPDLLRLDDEMIELCSFMKEMTLCTYGDAIHTILPAAVLSRFEEYYSVSEKKLPQNAKGLDTQALFIYRHIEERRRASLGSLKSRFGTASAEKIRKLCENGYLRRELELKNKEVGIERATYFLSANKETLEKALLTKAFAPRSPKQWSIVCTLAENGEMGEDDLLRASKAAKQALTSLLTKGLVGKKTETLYRKPLEITEAEEKREIYLNDEQKEAYDTLSSMLQADKPAAALLHGVTGSGKTSVMLKTIDYCLSLGKGAIVLLPEISLTPQMLGIFCGRYGERVAVIHSGLSGGERIDTYTLIKDGKADVVVGTRSAVFAPVKKLGLIVIDEEQEHTYKSDQNPKYHTKDIARFRCAKNNAVMLLSSATPSIESYQKALEGTYQLLKLKNRFGGATLPDVLVEDMRIETRAGNVTPLGKTLAKSLIEARQKGEQSILFINRRGYHNYVSCRSCGKALACPRCSVSLTHHAKKGSYEKGDLVCHFCGLRMPIPTTCPECGSEHLSFVGYGTQRVERELNDTMPKARILRMDTDTTATREAYTNILGAFRAGEADILLGTQMVTKGHDFPDVTLVGVLLADSSLYLDDYRAAERTFSLLTQVVGRAGRASKKGRAIIQTNNPDHEVIRLACAQDYESFYEREIKMRKLLSFPPYCDIVLFNIVSDNENELMLACKRFSEDFKVRAMREYPDIPLVVFGPFEAPVYRMDNKYRMRMVVKCKLGRKSRAFFSELLREFGKESGSKTTLSIDLNPTNL